MAHTVAARHHVQITLKPYLGHVYSRETVLSGADMNTSQLKRKEGERRGNLSRLPPLPGLLPGWGAA